AAGRPAKGVRPLDPSGKPITFDRRRFLVLAGGTVAYLALRPHLAAARKAAQSVPTLQAWELPGEPPRDEVERARALIGAAVLAPSTWNSQPWQFEVDGETIRLLADPRRAMPIIDPTRKSMMISLGAALEDLLITARAFGLMPT